MICRVRAAAMIINPQNQLLLVFHRNPDTSEEWLMPPGGGLEPGESAIEALKREVYEECLIDCIPERLIYVREYLDCENNVHHISLFFTAYIENFNVKTGIDPEMEEQHIVETRFYSREEIERTSVPIYPEIIKNQFWKDFEKDFLGHTVYLGIQR